MIKLMIADDHLLFRQGISGLLKTVEEFEIVSECANGKAVIQVLEKEPVDIILMDLNMPEMDGIETTKIIRKNYPDIRIIILSMLYTMDAIECVTAMNVNGYLSKDTGKAELILAINEVISGRDYFSKKVMKAIVDGLKSANSVQPIRLTPREMDVLKLIFAELTTIEIAERLFISTNTVETHRKNLLHKTGSRNSLGLIKFVIDNQLFK